MEPIHQNWTDSEGNPQGGVSTGIGFTVSWQRGPLNENGRNGAFLLEVIGCCLERLQYFQNSKFACDENAEAIDHLTSAISALSSRKERRQSEGTLGTHNL